MDAAIHIANGSDEKLYLGRLDIVRDCGWAGEYFEAMWRKLQQSHPENFLVGTARCHLRAGFVKVVFDGIGFDWREQVIQDLALQRTTTYMLDMVEEIQCHAQRIETKDEI